MIKHICAALILATSTGAAFAVEEPAQFDAKSCKADYPRASLMNEEEGTVSMRFLIGADGRVLESVLDKSSGFKSLDKAAMKSISACRFKPGRKDGKVDTTWTQVDYAWKLS